MKILITGHTQGIGEVLYNHWTSLNHEVIGLSRSTGYDFNKISDVLEEASTADLFVNNANVQDSQTMFLKHLLNRVPRMVVIGTGLHNFTEYGTFEYIEKKKQLFNLVKNNVMNPEVNTKLLHLGLTFLPESYVDEENFIPWDRIINVIDFWIENPVFWDVNYNWKATNLVCDKLKEFIPELDIKFS